MTCFISVYFYGAAFLSCLVLPSVMQKTLRKATSWAEMDGSLQCRAKTEDLKVQNTEQHINQK